MTKLRRTLLSCLSLGLASTLLTGGGTMGPLAAGLASGVAGNLAHDLFKTFDRHVAERFLDGWSSIDENHHISRALRLAQIAGLRAVLARFDSSRDDGDPDIARKQEAMRFGNVLREFLSRETTAAQGTAFGADAGLTDREQAIRGKVLLALPEAFDESLATRRATGERSAMLESLRQLRGAVEAAVLEEVRLQTLDPNEPFPTGFCSIFEGDGADGWFDLFVRDAAAKLKDGTEFERVWNAEQVALVKAIVEAQTQKLDRIERGVASNSVDLAELLAIARSGGVFQRAAEQGISEAGVRAIVERLGGESVGRDDLLSWLDNWIEAARQALGQHSNEGEAFEAARHEAERRFRAGGLPDASAAFMDEYDREERAEQERQDERKHQRLRLLEEAIRFDSLGFNTQAIVPKLRLMASIEGVPDGDSWGAWLLTKAEQFYERGRDKGINADLVTAIATFGAVLEERTRERAPLDWARTQNKLGNALQTLGERESGTARLEAAVVAYRSALEERTRERAPLDWAATQTNLGAALQTLGARESGTARLEEAVKACRSALEQSTRERVKMDAGPLDQCAEDGQESTRERVKLDWAATQNTLGNALSVLGEREGGTARLREAAAAFQSALEEWTRERVPLDWATARNNLGIALRTLGVRERCTARLEAAVAAHRSALKERTRERVPLDWAYARHGLADALAEFAKRRRDPASMREALAAMREAAEVYREGRVAYWLPIAERRVAAMEAELAALQREAGN